ncbi:MAG: glycerol-3-phosphate responsive antiterminator [Betaproteobacteria bacterium]
MSRVEGAALIQRLRRKPVIGGLKQGANLNRGIDAGVEVFFALTGTIFDLEVTAARVREAGRLILAHIDLLEGVGRDAPGIRFLARNLGIHGILSTRNSLIRAAREAGLLAVQRLFLLDSEALSTGLSVAERSTPDAIEVLPGLVIPQVVHRLPIRHLPPLIGGGLVETPEEVCSILDAGAVAVSTSREELWNYVRPAKGSSPADRIM